MGFATYSFWNSVTPSRAMSLLCLIVFLGTAGKAGEPRPCACEHRAVKSRILDGTSVPTSQFPTVGEIGDDANGTYCTGTLISSNVVLCAAHCAADDNGVQVLADTAGRFILGGNTYHTKKIVVHPSYKGFVGDVDGQFDVSVMILDTPVPNVTPTPLYRKTPAAGTVLTLAGFGELGTGAAGGNGMYPGQGTIYTGTTPLETVTASFLHWTFDSGESDTAPGDSGGPAFITESGVRYLAGITSGGTGEGFHNASFDTRVDAVAAWVDSVIAAQGGNAFSLLLSGPNVNRNPAAPGESVQFSAAAPTNVALKWNFGDGSPEVAGAIVPHTFGSEGTYLVTLTATSGAQSSAATLTMLISMGAPPDSSDFGVVPVAASKKRFLIQFDTTDRSRFGIVLESPAFDYADRTTFEAAQLNTDARVYFGGALADTVPIIGAKSPGIRGDAALVWNYKRGQVKYFLHGEVVNQYLVNYGAVNADADTSLSIPFFVVLNGTRYGGDYVFAYKARLNRGGTGK